MCGRFTLATPAEEWAALFRIEEPLPVAPRYNIAPTQDVAIIRAAGAGRRPGAAAVAVAASPARREGALLRWGLVPHWAKEIGPGPPLINARAETVAEKPSFRDAYRDRRCLVVADGFYEWQPAGRRKQPYWIGLADGRPFALAGVWDRWKPPGATALDSCAILTTEANEVLRELHDRMPVVLDPEAYDLWLDPEAAPKPLDLEALARPYPAQRMTFFPVSARVNHVANDDPECVKPLHAQTDLFG